MVFIRNKGTNRRISLQNQIGTQLRQQKVEPPENSALKGPLGY